MYVCAAGQRQVRVSEGATEECGEVWDAANNRSMSRKQCHLHAGIHEATIIALDGRPDPPCPFHVAGGQVDLPAARATQ